jgi:hypothetical protein
MGLAEECVVSLKGRVEEDPGLCNPCDAVALTSRSCGFPSLNMPVKSIFRQPDAKHFQLVHRSQRDPLIHDPEAGDRILRPIQRKKAFALSKSHGLFH